MLTPITAPPPVRPPAPPKPDTIVKEFQRQLTDPIPEGSGAFSFQAGTAGVGGAQSFETMRFGDDVAFLCGAGAALGYDLSLSAGAGTTLSSPGCTGAAKYGGGSLSVNLGIGTPLAHAGVGASLVLGIDDALAEKHLPALIDGLGRHYTNNATKNMIAAITTASAALKMPAGPATILIARFIAGFVIASGGKAIDSSEALLAGLPDPQKELTNFLATKRAPDMKPLIAAVAKELDKTDPPIAEALGHLIAMMSGCDALQVNGNVGISGTPFSATIGYAHSEVIGAMRLPVDLWGAENARRNFVDSRLPTFLDFGKLGNHLKDTVDPKILARNEDTMNKLAKIGAAGPLTQALYCTQPALSAACKLAAAMQDKGLPALAGAGKKACDEGDRLADLVRKDADALADPLKYLGGGR